MRTTNPFEAASAWDTGFAETAEPAFRKALMDAAGVDEKTWQAAYDRVVCDGNYGPISDADWNEQDGRKMRMSDAKRILREGYDGFSVPSGFKYELPDVGATCNGSHRRKSGDCHHSAHRDLREYGPMFHSETLEIERDTYLRWYFSAITEIYGAPRVP